jgi:hypothetical protein
LENIMNLEERYNAASNDTYVGKVRLQQAADVGVGAGVNFLDGDGRSRWSPATTARPDVVQTEFTRNAEGNFRYGGGGKSPALTNNGSYPLSRWLARGVEKGDAYFANNRFTTIGDIRNATGTIIHKYWSATNKKFQNADTWANTRITSSPGGPSPAGLGG